MPSIGPFHLLRSARGADPTFIKTILGMIPKVCLPRSGSRPYIHLEERQSTKFLLYARLLMSLVPFIVFFEQLFVAGEKISFFSINKNRLDMCPLFKNIPISKNNICCFSLL